MIRKLTTVAVAGVMAAAAVVAPPAMGDTYDDPWLVNWPAVLPGAPASHDPSMDGPASTEGAAPARTRGSEDCLAGSLECVDNVIDEMTTRWHSLACDHNGTFALTYLITTIQYHHSVQQEGFYSDPEFLNHYDAVFADFYFDAYDDWLAGDDEVPEAWTIAFEAAADGSVTGFGDMVLGMNAHIVRDLPFVIERIGLVAPDGTSRHADHSKVNVFLNAAAKVVSQRVAEIYDPTIDDGESSFEGEGALSLQLIIEWREEAWRKAEMLHHARQQGPEAYAAAAALVESDATERARALTRQYAADEDQRAARDAHCAAAWPERDDDRILSPYTG